MNRWLFAVIIDWSLILLSFVAVDKWSWCAPLTVFLVGIQQHAIGLLGHEAAHQKGWLNDLLANLLCFWPIGSSISAYRDFHFAHHRYQGDLWRDPEEIHRQRLSRWQWTTPCSMTKRVVLFVLDHLFLGAVEVSKAIRLVGDPVAAFILVIAFVILWQYCPVGLLWYVSLITTFWAVFRIRIWTEHVGSSDGTHRSTTPSWWMRPILRHHTYKHREHHADPNKRLYLLEINDE